MAYRTKKIKYEELEREKIPFLMPILYEIDWNGVTYEILINHKARCKRAVVFGTGAIVKDKPLPVFSRAAWMHQMSYTGIWYFDPTVYLGDLALGWGYGTNQRWYLKDIAHLLQIILRKLKIKSDNTLFFGSSGGGFTSILLASMFQSRATAINPQLSVQDYFAGSVQQLEAVVLKPDERLLQERTSVATFIKENGYMPSIHLVENLFSSSDIQTQLRLFLARMAEERIDCTDRLRVDFYSAKGGHGAMPSKEDCLRIIEEDLNRPLPRQRNIILEKTPMSVTMTLDAKIEENRFVVRVKADPVNEFTMYAYYLCKDTGGNALIKQGYIPSSQFEFPLAEPGIYSVIVFVKSKYSVEEDYTMISAFSEQLFYPGV